MTEVEALAKYASRASFADLSRFGRPIRDIRRPGASTPIESRPWSGVSYQTASASIIRFVVASGCETSARWLALISIVFAPIRLAMKRSRSGLIVRSWVDTA